MAIDNELINDKRLPVDPTFGEPAPALGSAKTTDIQELSGGPIYAPVSRKVLVLLKYQSLETLLVLLDLQEHFKVFPKANLLKINAILYMEEILVI